MALGCRAGLASTPAVIVRRPPILQFEVHFLLLVGVSLSVRPSGHRGVVRPTQTGTQPEQFNGRALAKQGRR